MSKIGDSMSATVSVVVPVFNSDLHLLGRSLESALRQSLPPQQVLIVDDGSAANYRLALARFMADYPSVEILWAPGNGGPGSARNLGWEKATGEFVAFLDSDDFWPLTKLRFQVDRMVLADAVMSGGKKVYTSCSSFPSGGFGSQSREMFVSRWGMLLRNRVATSSVMVSRNATARFTAGRSFSEDWELWIRLAREGRVLVHDSVLAYESNGRSASGLSDEYWKMWRGELETLELLRRDGVISRLEWFAAVTVAIVRGCVRPGLRIARAWSRGRSAVRRTSGAA